MEVIDERYVKKVEVLMWKIKEIWEIDKMCHQQNLKTNCEERFFF